MATDSLKPWPPGELPKEALCGEETRLAVLATYGLDALQDDPELCEITEFAALLCDAPIAMVSLIEEERQLFLTRAGLEDRETPRSVSFCAHAMLEPEPMVIADARLDPRFAANPLVTGHPYVRFYAGAPLVSHDGAPLGSLCIIDTKPRPEGLNEKQRAGLQVLAHSVMRRLRHRRENIAQRAELEQSERQLQTLIDSLPTIAYSIRDDGSFFYVNAQFKEIVGVPAPRVAEDWRAVIHPDDHEPLFTDWYETFAKGAPFEGKFRLKQADGSWRWSLTRVNPVNSRTGAAQQWFGTVTDIEDTYREGEARQLVANELSHRIKNLFAVIGGLVRLKGREFPAAEPFVEDLAQTLASLNRAHGYVMQDHAGSEDTLQGLIGKLLEPYRTGEGERLKLSGSDAPISSNSTTPLALVFHELATNSVKYGSLSVPEGTVAITIARVDDTVSITWQEIGGPPPETQLGSGFGSRLVERTVNGQLRGQLNRSYTAAGLIANLIVPADAL